jgi:uroporphyrinogen III methyltransferase/synthase
VASAIEIHPPSDPKPLENAVRNLRDYGWVAFTSANGAHHFFRALREARLDARAIAGKVAAIGTQTALAVEEHGVTPDAIAKEFVGEALAETMLSQMAPSSRVLVPRAKEAREVLPEMLRAKGHTVDVVTAYETKAPAAEKMTALRDAAARADAVLLTSSSTAKNLVETLGGPDSLSRAVVASIGPITTETAEKLGLRVALTAEVHTTAGLVDSLEAYFSRK